MAKEKKREEIIPDGEILILGVNMKLARPEEGHTGGGYLTRVKFQLENGDVCETESRSEPPPGFVKSLSDCRKIAIEIGEFENRTKSAGENVIRPYAISFKYKNGVLTSAKIQIFVDLEKNPAPLPCNITSLRFNSEEESDSAYTPEQKKIFLKLYREAQKFAQGERAQGRLL